ncbi:MAG TPA: PH domain-containing protein [Nitrososphaeraceae archaeon]|nr:PH domain-containing protein [Nitrososphaeraceae archaeon]
MRFTTNLTSQGDLDEITKISDILNPDEKVLLVAKQSRIKPGGSKLTPNIVYATDKRIIIRDPYMLGMRENIVDIPYDIITSVKLEKGILSSTIRFRAPGLVSSSRLGMIDGLIDGEHDQDGKIDAIPKDKAEKLLETIREGMQGPKTKANTNMSQQQQIPPSSTVSNQSISIADELAKLAKLKDQEVITENEFLQMKHDLINKKM